MAKTVDARGLSCPQPVILARTAVQEGQFPIKVWVDTVTARENVRRACEKMGCRVTIAEGDGDFELTLTQ